MMRFKVSKKNEKFRIKFRAWGIWRYLKRDICFANEIREEIMSFDTLRGAFDEIVRVCGTLDVDRCSVKAEFTEMAGEKSGN